MSPRRYTMKNRSSAVAKTRRRIVEATLKLHGAKGIFGTRWQDIAREADVSLGTVYKHFPSLDDLLPACGALLMERIQPPSPEDADRIIGDAIAPAERLRRVVEALFAFYERGGTHLESDLQERQLPAMQEWEQHMRDMVAGFASAALDGQKLSAERLAMISALLDFPSYRAMRTRDIDPDRAIEDTTAIIMSWLEKAPGDAGETGQSETRSDIEPRGRRGAQPGRKR